MNMMNISYKRTDAHVDLDAIAHNMREVRRITDPHAKIMTIIKADAYGHGAVKVSGRLDAENLTDAYGVAIVEEGISLRIAGITKPILLLGYSAPEVYPQVVEYELTQTIFSEEMAEALSKTCVKMGKAASINIKLDTGMGRIGFAPCDETLKVITRIAKLPGLSITGVFSHLACADEADKTSAEKQFEIFTTFCDRIEKEGIEIPMRHIANSAAIIDLPHMHLDMVRSGIITYGMYPSDQVDKSRIDLIPALSWKTHVSFVKDVHAGATISYGATFTADHTMRVATIPVGYADGYPRSLSGKGRVLIAGQSAPILGRICMDQFMVDVSKIDGVKPGDRVTLVGRDGDAFIPIEEPADLSGSFNYEFACNIGRRVERSY